MQVNHEKLQKYLGMTLDYTKSGQLKITMLEYIDEILDVFDKADPTGVVTKSSTSPDIVFKVDKDCKKLIPQKLWSFITWWRKYYLLSNRPGRTHAPQFNFSP